MQDPRAGATGKVRRGTAKYRALRDALATAALGFIPLPRYHNVPWRMSGRSTNPPCE